MNIVITPDWENNITDDEFITLVNDANDLVNKGYNVSITGFTIRDCTLIPITEVALIKNTFFFKKQTNE